MISFPQSAKTKPFNSEEKSTRRNTILISVDSAARLGSARLGSIARSTLSGFTSRLHFIRLRVLSALIIIIIILFRK